MHLHTNTCLPVLEKLKLLIFMCYTCFQLYLLVMRLIVFTVVYSTNTVILCTKSTENDVSILL